MQPKTSFAEYVIAPFGGDVLARFSTDVLDGRYRFVNRDGSELPAFVKEPVVVPVLGAGAFGAVVRTRDRVELDRAVKILDPSRVPMVPVDEYRTQHYTADNRPSPSDADAISSRFQQEIKHTNARTFKNILPIIDYGKVRDVDGRSVMYYVSPFIDGFRLDDFVAQRIPKDDKLSRTKAAEYHDLLLGLIDDLLAAVEELEEAAVVHMDIKPANIMVLTGAEPASRAARDAKGAADRLFLVDLGAARSAALPARTVPLIMTPYFFPTHLLNDLGYDPRNSRVDHAKLMTFGAKIDLFSAGRTLELMLLDRVRRKSSGVRVSEELRIQEARKEHVFRSILEDDFEVMEGLVSRLIDTGSAAFPSATQARLGFQILARRASRSVFASRVLTDQAVGLRIRVGRALVRIAPPFVEIIDHPVFQRLRRLQQLAMLSEVFPDATHTRFAHVLHTFHVAKRFIRGLYRDTRLRQIFTQNDVDHVLAAALLHDIGQYPFSHTIEDLRKIGDICKVAELQGIRYDQELAAEYIDRAEPGRKSIATILKDHGFSVASILYLFQKTKKERGTDASSIGRDIISGVIDVDRVSYLLGDSDRSGMSFGAAMDIDGLVEALCIRPADTDADASLAIDEGGISSVEAMLTAVYWMYRNVYWRHTNRGFMAAVKFVVQMLLEQKYLTFEEYKERVYGRSEWDALIFLRDKFSDLNNNECADLYNPLETITSHRRFAYRRVFSMGVDVSTILGGNSPKAADSELYWQLVRNISPALCRDIIDSVGGMLPATSRVRPGDILIDIPLKKRLRQASMLGDTSPELEDTAADAGARSRMWVRKRAPRGQPAEWQDLFGCSPLSALLGSLEDHSGRKIRVFFSRDLLTRIPGYLEPNLAEQIRIQLTTAVGLVRDPEKRPTQ